MLKKKRVVIPSLISAMLILMIVICSLWLKNLTPEIEQKRLLSEKLTAINLKDTKRINSIKVELIDSQLKIKSLEEERIVKAKALTIYKHYRDCGTLYENYWISPEYLENIIKWGRKHREHEGKFNYDTLESENFYLCWIANETNFDSSRWLIKTNKYGKKDFWIMQMNECHYVKAKRHLWIEAENLHPELKGTPDWNVEKNICVWYLWMGKQATHSVWNIWNKYRTDVRELYFKLRRIK